jgi:hypothetical protein
MLSANPLLLMAATDGREDCQLTCVVRLCVEPSEYVPVAVNCCVFPLATEAVAGLMLTDTSVTGSVVTVRAVELATPLS